MLNPEVPKCHEDLITLESYVQLGKTMDNKFFISENINIFGYLGAWGGFNTVTGPILVHIYPLFNNNCMSNIESSLIRTFWVKIENIKNILFLSLHKIHGYQEHQHVSKFRPHHSGNICTTRGNNLKTKFFIYGAKCTNIYILGYFWGPGGSSIIRLGLSCLSAIISPISMYM